MGEAFKWNANSSIHDFHKTTFLSRLASSSSESDFPSITPCNMVSSDSSILLAVSCVRWSVMHVSVMSSREIVQCYLEHKLQVKCIGKRKYSVVLSFLSSCPNNKNFSTGRKKARKTMIWLNGVGVILPVTVEKVEFIPVFNCWTEPRGGRSPVFIGGPHHPNWGNIWAQRDDIWYDSFNRHTNVPAFLPTCK